MQKLQRQWWSNTWIGESDQICFYRRQSYVGFLGPIGIRFDGPKSPVVSNRAAICGNQLWTVRPLPYTFQEAPCSIVWCNISWRMEAKRISHFASPSFLHAYASVRSRNKLEQARLPQLGDLSTLHLIHSELSVVSRNDEQKKENRTSTVAGTSSANSEFFSRLAFDWCRTLVSPLHAQTHIEVLIRAT